MRMMVPTCSPRSAAVSRPGTSPFTICTRSRWRAVAMTSRSARSTGNVPVRAARSAALVSRISCAVRSASSTWIGVVHAVDVLHDREPSGTECVGDKKCTRVRAVRRDARGRELVVVIRRKGAAHDRAGGAEMDRELIRDGRVLDVGDPFRREQCREDVAILASLAGSQRSKRADR